MTEAVLVVVLVAAALAALAAGVVLDRGVAMRVERTAALYLSAPFGHAVTVHVQGRPFLSQALRGRYRDVEVLGALRLGVIERAPLVAHLANVHLPLGDLLRRRVRELPCEHIEGRLVLGYRELSRAARIPGLELFFEGQRLRASAALPVPGMSQVLPRLSVPVPLPQLPYGLRLDAVRPTATGLVVDASAAAVVLRPTGPATPERAASELIFEVADPAGPAGRPGS